MKAKIEFEVEDTNDNDETKQKLIEEIANIVQSWLDGKDIMTIE